jgi:hypothetical protein
MGNRIELWHHIQICVHINLGVIFCVCIIYNMSNIAREQEWLKIIRQIENDYYQQQMQQYAVVDQNAYQNADEDENNVRQPPKKSFASIGTYGIVKGNQAQKKFNQKPNASPIDTYANYVYSSDIPSSQDKLENFSNKHLK